MKRADSFLRADSGLRGAILTLAICMAVGCGGGPTLRGRTVPVSAEDWLEKAPQDYAPEVAKMTAFPMEEPLKAKLLSGVPADAQKALIPTPALTCLALTLAETFAASRERPVRTLQRWLGWRCGWPSDVSIQLAVRPEADDAALDGELAAAGKRIAARSPHAAFGVARITRDRNVIQYVVFDEHDLELTPIAKRYAPGAQLTLRMRPSGDLKEGTAFADAEGGKVEAYPLAIAADGTWTCAHTLPRTPGRYFVEIVGRGASGAQSRSLARFPVLVGVAEPAAPDDYITAPQGSSDDAARWPALIVAKYNAERSRRGLGLLTTDARLGKLAQEEAESVAASTSTKSAADLKAAFDAAGINPSSVWRSQAWMEIVSEYVASELQRPTVRARLQRPESVRVGIGIARKPGKEDDAPEYAVVEYWTW